ncbi:hypothetical protein COY95_01385 [Candidatus Woesearchaeota archaeon CG_4_10_14_0_8_um_filter_47_5]|nr:MAG: hypothetical protein COY95_01385 [Candidatus Woesearchaeota archaeon CG_4_10_14_0_8_um_filter_47_5]
MQTAAAVQYPSLFSGAPLDALEDLSDKVREMWANSAGGIGRNFKKIMKAAAYCIVGSALLASSYAPLQPHEETWIFDYNGDGIQEIVTYFAEKEVMEVGIGFPGRTGRIFLTLPCYRTLEYVCITEGDIRIPFYNLGSEPEEGPLRFMLGTEGTFTPVYPHRPFESPSQPPLPLPPPPLPPHYSPPEIQHA